MRKSIIADIIAFVFILLFTYAAASKLLDFTKFRAQLGLSPLLTAFAGWVAWLVPMIEIGISFILFSPRFRLVGFFASFSLMTMFTTYIIVITRFADFVPCSCGGVLQNMSWDQHIIFNLFFIIAGLIGIIQQCKLYGPPDTLITSFS